jgi:hypothetical protein
VTDYSDPSKLLTPVKAIRAKCIDCTGHQPKEVRECPVYYCPCWPYRMGRRPSETTYAERPPRYEVPPHLPVWQDGRIVSPEKRQKS